MWRYILGQKSKEQNKYVMYPMTPFWGYIMAFKKNFLFDIRWIGDINLSIMVEHIVCNL